MEKKNAKYSYTQEERRQRQAQAQAELLAKQEQERAQAEQGQGQEPNTMTTAQFMAIKQERLKQLVIWAVGTWLVTTFIFGSMIGMMTLIIFIFSDYLKMNKEIAELTSRIKIKD